MLLKDKPIASPLNYIGGKYKLLPQIFPLFPDNVDTFVDIFCGGCNVGINASANRIICNDLDSNLIGLFNYFKSTKHDVLKKKLIQLLNITNSLIHKQMDINFTTVILVMDYANIIGINS